MSQSRYQGVEALEVLASAKNYNAYILDEILRHCDVDADVLDFGAGTGTFAYSLSGLVRTVSAVETDSQLLANLRASAVVNAEPDVADFASSFDLVYLVNVLEHIEDDSAALVKIARSVSPSGLVMIYVPASPLLFSNFDRAVGHYRRYTTRSLRAVAEKAGLAIVSVKYVDPLGWFVAMLHKVLGRRPVLKNWQVQTFDRAVFPLSMRIEPLTREWFGKNIILVARPAHSGTAREKIG